MDNRTPPSDGIRLGVAAGSPVPYDAVKRLVDLIASAGALVLFSPLLLAVALAIRIDDRGPALFRQDRIGRNGSHFTMLKFRSMSQGTPNISTEEMKSFAAVYDTRVGKWLRKTSLDELPQLWNILRGEMSFVGPRPALCNQELLTSLRDSAAVLCVRPGITGLAQISGRDDLDIPTKVAYDWEYIRDRNLRLDIQIVLKTVWAVVSSRGNY
jgi:O-antigen biosynthesis protein WbqP